MREPLYIVFDAPPSHDSGRFVEVENADGESRKVGEWEQYGEFWRLGPVYAEEAVTEPTAKLRAALELVLDDKGAEQVTIDAARQALGLEKPT